MQEKDVEAEKAIRNAAAHIILQYARVGVNVLAYARWAVDQGETE